MPNYKITISCYAEAHADNDKWARKIAESLAKELAEIMPTASASSHLIYEIKVASIEHLLTSED